jgi:hypothetical protein
VFGDTSDIAKTAALLLAVLLPAIGFLYQYRREMAKAASPPSVGAGGLAVVGGVLAGERATREYIESQEDMSRAIEELGKAVREGTLEIARTSRENNAELRRISAALENVVHQMQLRPNS